MRLIMWQNHRQYAFITDSVAMGSLSHYYNWHQHFFSPFAFKWWLSVLGVILKNIRSANLIKFRRRRIEIAVLYRRSMNHTGIGKLREVWQIASKSKQFANPCSCDQTLHTGTNSWAEANSISKKSARRDSTERHINNSNQRIWMKS